MCCTIMDVILWQCLIEVVELDEMVQMTRLAEAKEKSHAMAIWAQPKKVESRQSESHSGKTESQFSLRRASLVLAERTEKIQCTCKTRSQKGIIDTRLLKQRIFRANGSSSLKLIAKHYVNPEV